MMAFQFTMNKLYQQKNGSAITTSLLYTTLSGFAGGLLFLCINGFKISITPFSVLCAAGIAILCVSYTLFGFKIFSIGNFSVFTMFLMLGGMLLPFIYGILFLGDVENMTKSALVCRITGVILLIISMVFPCLSEKSGESRGKSSKMLFIFLCLCVFFMNGFVSILSKVHQIESTYATVDANSFVIITNVINGLVSGAVLLGICISRKKLPKLAPDFSKLNLAVIVVLYAAFNDIAYLLQLIVAASDLPASVQYPMVTGGSIVLTALSGYVFFKEKPSKTALIGIVLAFASTFLFLVK